MHAGFFPSSRGIVTKVKLEALHLDLYGPMAEKSLGGAHYLLVITDDFTRKSFVILLTHKDDTFEEFQRFKALKETKIGYKITRIRTDRGGEFKSTHFKQLLEEDRLESIHIADVMHIKEKGSLDQQEYQI